MQPNLISRIDEKYMEPLSIMYSLSGKHIYLNNEAVFVRDVILDNATTTVRLLDKNNCIIMAFAMNELEDALCDKLKDHQKNPFIKRVPKVTSSPIKEEIQDTDTEEDNLIILTEKHLKAMSKGSKQASDYILAAMKMMNDGQMTAEQANAVAQLNNSFSGSFKVQLDLAKTMIVEAKELAEAYKKTTTS